MKEILTWISSLWRLKSGLQSTKKEILTLIFTLWWLKTWLQSIMEEDGWLA